MKTLGKTSLSSVLKVVLDVSWYLVIVISLVIVTQAVLGLLRDPAQMRLDLLFPFALDASSYAISSGELGVEGAWIVDAIGELRIRSESRTLVLAWLVVALAWMGAMLVVLYQLRRLFATLSAGDPFVKSNAARIRAIGLVVIALELVQVALVFAQSLYLRSTLELVGVSVRSGMRVDVGVIFLGLALLVIAEVFRLGAQLREEQALTV